MKLLELFRKADKPPRVTNLGGPPEVDRTYLVPVIDVFVGGATRRLPVVPHPHRDPELGNDTLHCHYDHRFTTVEERAALVESVGKNVVPTVAISGGKQSDIRYAWEPRRCQRDWKGADPLGRQQENLLSAVNGLDAHCKDMVCAGRYCPHKGFDLQGVKPNRDGSVTCPLHGAIWDRDGKYVLRRNIGQQMLAKLFDAHPELPPTLTLTMRLFTGYHRSHHRNLRASMRLEHFAEYGDCTPREFEATYCREQVRLRHEPQVVPCHGTALIRGYFITMAGHRRPVWADVFTNHRGHADPFAVSPASTVSVSEAYFT